MQKPNTGRDAAKKCDPMIVMPIKRLVLVVLVITLLLSLFLCDCSGATAAAERKEFIPPGATKWNIYISDTLYSVCFNSEINWGRDTNSVESVSKQTNNSFMDPANDDSSSFE